VIIVGWSCIVIEVAQTNPTLWYLANRATIVYTIIHRVMSELKKRVPGFEPSSILDYGARTGMGAWATGAIWPESIKTYVAVEENTDFGFAIQEFARDSGVPIKVRPIIPALPSATTTTTSSSSTSSSTPNASGPTIIRRTGVTAPTLTAANEDVVGPHPLVIAAYSLHTIPKAQRKVLLDQLWANTKDILVIIEAGDPAGFDVIRSARDYLLHTTKTKEGRDPANSATAIAPVRHPSL
jgi:ribosomal protein RSM22 (predicted rRNA methylase)